MKRRLLLVTFFITVGMVFFYGCSGKEQSIGRISFQLNWLHDPTFAGHYMWAKSTNGEVLIREGGANIAPLAEVVSRRADLAVVGADIFLQKIAESLAKDEDAGLMVISVDFQRNPVGWIMHPDAVKNEGLTDWQNMSESELNQWLFKKAKSGNLTIGDKRGTETTAVWIRWSKIHDANDLVVVPVGFDASVVLSAPKMAYPVYLNEEPFKLGDRIGRPVVIFDPAADNVNLYGNVVVCRKEMFNRDSTRVRSIAKAISDGWQLAKDNPENAVETVMEVYTDVDKTVVKSQVDKTLDFVFRGVSEAGYMDVEPGGLWDQTINTLQEAGVLPSEFTLEDLKKHVLQ